MVTNEGGNIVYERELTQDEIIGEILKRDEEVVEAVAKTKGKGGRKAGTKYNCSVCGVSGHTVRTCPKNKPKDYGFESGKPIEGSPDETLSYGAVSKFTYGQLKARQAQDISQEDASEEFVITQDEVRSVFASKHYLDYIKIRRDH